MSRFWNKTRLVRSFVSFLFFVAMGTGVAYSAYLLHNM